MSGALKIVPYMSGVVCLFAVGWVWYTVHKTGLPIGVEHDYAMADTVQAGSVLAAIGVGQLFRWRPAVLVFSLGCAVIGFLYCWEVVDTAGENTLKVSDLLSALLFFIPALSIISGWNTLRPQLSNG